MKVVDGVQYMFSSCYMALAYCHMAWTYLIRNCKKLGASRESTTGQQILMCIRLRAGRRTPRASSSNNMVIILKWGSVVPAGDPSCSFVFADGI